jgi:DNA-binding SARP family transcriptional activator
VVKVILTLLGGFAAEADGEPVPHAAWRLKKARELVKLLALADSPTASSQSESRPRLPGHV